MSKLSLYHAEERLTELLDTEGLVPEDRLAEFARELTAAENTAVARRDAVIQFIRHVEGQIDFARAEEKRLAEWRKSNEAKLEAFKGYVARVIEQNVPMPKKGVRKLEGHCGELRLAKLPDSCEITDVEQIPSRYARVTVQMPYLLWASVYCALDGDSSLLGGAMTEDIRAVNATKKLDHPLTPIKEALKRGEDVPGADLKINQYKLEVK